MGPNSRCGHSFRGSLRHEGARTDEAPRWVLYVCVAIFGGTIVPTHSIVMVHGNDALGKDEFVAAPGALLIVQGAGAAASPVRGGLAMSVVPRALWYTLITTQLLMAA